MGALCCCPSSEDFDEYASYSTGCIYQHCFCFRCCVHLFLHMYTGLFRTAEGRDLSSAMQSMGTSASAGLLVATSVDISSPDTYRAPPRPLPYDTEQRYVRLQREGLVSRREKIGLSQLHGGEIEPSRRVDSDSGEQMPIIQRRNGVDYGEQSQEYHPDSPSGQWQSTKPIGRINSMMSLGDDEDVCPTCLEGYNDNDPKISTQCGHHFHLGCIYEWMERSKHCPICDQEMILNESP
eukprot:c27683_g1_i1 orf=1317-2027(+)